MGRGVDARLASQRLRIALGRSDQRGAIVATGSEREGGAGTQEQAVRSRQRQAEQRLCS